MRGLFRLPCACFQARRLVKRLRPDAVSASAATRRGRGAHREARGVPTAICEQNSVPGFTTSPRQARPPRVPRVRRLAAFFARRADLDDRQPDPRGLVAKLPSQPTADGSFTCWSAAARWVRSRSTSWRRGADASSAKKNERSRSCIRPAKKGLEMRRRERRRRCRGRVECTRVHQRHGDRVRASDLMIGRAGATTVAELAIAGKPAVSSRTRSPPTTTRSSTRRDGGQGRRADVRQADTTAERSCRAAPVARGAEVREQMGAAMRGFGKPGALLMPFV